MTPSAFIARILGPILVVVGLGMLLQTEFFRVLGNEFLKSPGLIYFSGFIALAVGLAILNLHNLWTRDWRVIITIFGWLSLIGGIFRILATTWVQQAGLEALRHPRGLVVAAVAQLVIGGYLTIMGYQDIWNSDGRQRGKGAGNTAKTSAAPARATKGRRQKSS